MKERNLEDEEFDDKNQDEVKHISIGILRVKDKLAALWPFLGICGEIIVLFSVLFTYEKMCKKPEDDDR